MKCNNFFYLLIILFFSNCQQNWKESKTNSLIDIKTKTDNLTLLGENIISTPLYERDIAITPQGNEIIYTIGDYKQRKRALVIVKKVNGYWGKPELMGISGKYQDIEPFYTNNGNRLYFASNRPIYHDSTRNDYNIWFTDRVKNGWTEPIALDSLINTNGDEFYPSLSEKGTLYFTGTRNNGVGKEDIFMSEFIDGKFNSPKPLPQAINSTLYEFNAYISPKEDMIIFSSFGRNDDLGGGDLYISQKDKSGNWTQSKNMGEAINSNTLDFCPFIDWKNRTFYFTSERTLLDNTELQSINALEKSANSMQNGFGNIYKISLDKLEKLNIKN